MLGLALAALCAGAGCGSQGTLSAKALGQQSKSVQSLAAEGALLAQDAAAGKSTGTFRREHSAELAAAAATAAASLGSAKTPPPLVPKLRRLESVAHRVAADLERLGHASTEEQRTLARTLEAAARQSERIGEELA
ncbi:MAG TPA: hypothetical protein VFD90_00120 [Gaiellales bacterium]|nr:hypothetical protein [Gaiellales bacterium]